MRLGNPAAFPGWHPSHNSGSAKGKDAALFLGVFHHGVFRCAPSSSSIDRYQLLCLRDWVSRTSAGDDAFCHSLLGVVKPDELLESIEGSVP